MRVKSESIGEKAVKVSIIKEGKCTWTEERGRERVKFRRF
jgi:hypothetical protein